MTQQGGLGFRHLGHEQGVQQTLQIIKHLQSQTMTGMLYHIMLQHYQLLSRFSKPVLEQTNAIPWSTTQWVDSLQGFLYHIKGQIILPHPWTLHPCRQHDVTIMEDIMALNHPRAKAIQVNSVHTYLKIKFLSEIINHSELKLLPQALSPQKSKSSFFHNNPNQSTLYWPWQPCLGSTAWKQWKEIILWMYTQPHSTNLLKPLGPCTTTMIRTIIVHGL